MNNTHLPFIQDYQAIIVNDRAKAMRNCKGTVKRSKHYLKEEGLAC